MIRISPSPRLLRELSRTSYMTISTATLLDVKSRWTDREREVTHRHQFSENPAVYEGHYARHLRPEFLRTEAVVVWRLGSILTRRYARSSQSGSITREFEAGGRSTSRRFQMSGQEDGDNRRIIVRVSRSVRGGGSVGVKTPSQTDATMEEKSMKDQSRHLGCNTYGNESASVLRDASFVLEGREAACAIAVELRTQYRLIAEEEFPHLDEAASQLQQAEFYEDHHWLYTAQSALTAWDALSIVIRLVLGVNEDVWDYSGKFRATICSAPQAAMPMIDIINTIPNQHGVRAAGTQKLIIHQRPDLLPFRAHIDKIYLHAGQIAGTANR
ncbi:hypothetical protein B0H21DRAFT_834372 [Amylocystis lapponica]|nr:hypothetical protein B0H21DRAFT_834372 [Amylocystis lapponica]